MHIVSGDKGGVGKSFTSLALIDYLTSVERKDVVVFEADKSNPDVARMYKDSVKCVYVDLATENGWMDVMDTVAQHPHSSFVMSTPAGIGPQLKTQIPGFKTFIAELAAAGRIDPLQLVLWWVMNPQHDSVNLLAEACRSYGGYFDQTRVVCNTHFSDGNKDAFFLWNDSPMRTKMAKEGAVTLFLPGLSLRVVAKLFHPEKIVPLSDAVDIALGEKLEFTESERHKLAIWRANVADIFADAFSHASAATKTAAAA